MYPWGSFLNAFSFSGTWVWTQGFIFARQVLYSLGHISIPTFIPKSLGSPFPICKMGKLLFRNCSTMPFSVLRIPIMIQFLFVSQDFFLIRLPQLSTDSNCPLKDNHNFLKCIKELVDVKSNIFNLSDIFFKIEFPNFYHILFFLE
jgi:hypothetical protein